MSRVVLDQVTKKYGETFAVRAVDLDIQEGEFLTLLGPSGCGKTTTLRMIAGFVLPSSGTVYLGDEDVTWLPPNKRGIGMVFQDYALFPHMTIGENIGFGLAERRTDKATISKRVKELLDMVQLSTFEHRYPPELSGGQQQRIAVARAVAYSPRVLLMDEPLGALDLKLREAMQGEIRQIQQRLGTTTVYVTHDQTEAMHMSDRIVVMKDGLIEQMGSAEEIYDRPQSRFVADFIGQINLLNADAVGHEGGFCVIDVEGTRVRVQQAPADARGKVTAGLRPQHLKIVPPGTACEGLNRLSGRIRNRIFSGNLSHVDIELTGGQTVTVETSPHDVVGETHSAVEVHWSPEHGCVLTR